MPNYLIINSVDKNNFALTVQVNAKIKRFRVIVSVFQLKGYLNVHEWHGWCGYAVDDLRREPLFPLKPQVRLII